MTEKNVPVSIAIVTYGDVNKEIEICLRSLENEIRVYDDVILIHEGSDLQFEEIQALAKINKKEINCTRLIDKKGLSNGRNLALDLCKTPWITFIDDDAKLLTGWRMSLERGITNYPESPGFTGPLIPIYEKKSRKLPREMEWVVSCDSFGGDVDKPTRNGYGANMTFNYQILEKNNFRFDAKLGWIGGHGGIGLAGEETVFCMKINQASKHSIMWLYDLKVGHHVPMTRMTLSYVMNRSWKEGKTKAYISKNESLKGHKGSLSKEINHLVRTIFIGVPREIVKIPIKPITSLWNITGIILMIANTGLAFLISK